MIERNVSRRLDRGSWAVLLLAVGIVVRAVLLSNHSWQQPSDGWLFVTEEEGVTAVASLTNTPSPLQPDDLLLAVAGIPIPTETVLRPITPPANWQIGQTIRYTVERKGEVVALDVLLMQRPFSAFLRYYQLSGNIWFTQLLWYLIGFGIFFLRPRDTAARLLLLITIFWATPSVDDWAYFFQPASRFYISLLLTVLWAYLFAMMLHLILTFPLTKWPLTRRPRLFLTLLYGVASVAFPVALITTNFTFYEAVLFPLIFLLVIALIVATIHNFWRVRDRVARAQTGWVIVGIASPIVGAFITNEWLMMRLLPSVENTSSFRNVVFHSFSLLLPLCFGIAITRYRLFDIHLIIRKTVQYGVVTAVLALVYFGTIILLQNLVGQAAGEQSPIVIVFSTLLIAAMFNPLRQRVQTTVDRRFYRQKYDAQQVLADFAQTARDEVQMEALMAELTHVIQETMQPQQISVWLKEEN